MDERRLARSAARRHPPGAQALADEAGGARRRRVPRGRRARPRRVGLRARGAALHARRDPLRSASLAARRCWSAPAWFLVRPLLRKVSDEQVALYLEEHEPSLEATIITAMEPSAGEPADMSPALVRKLIEDGDRARARDRRRPRASSATPVRRYAHGRRAWSPSSPWRSSPFGPAYLRHALSALFVISRDVEAAAPYRIDVTPGNATVPKGADQTISATLRGFEAADAAVFMRKGADAALRARADGARRERRLRRACSSTSPTASSTSSKPPACARRRSR